MLMVQQVYLTAKLGTFDVAATVDRVSVKGDGEKSMTLSSPLLSALNRQLQFVTYTNTVFHPRTADTGDFTSQIRNIEFHSILTTSHIQRSFEDFNHKLRLW